MRPRIGARRGALALAIALGIATAAPGIASADDGGGVTLTRFKLPDRGAVDQLNALGADLAENVTEGQDGSVYVDAVVTADQLAQYRALGYEPVQTLSGAASEKANAADIAATDRAAKDAAANLKAGGKTAKSKSLAATDTVNAQRADYFENYAGRFISIEAWTSNGGYSATSPGSYAGPALQAEWLDGAGATMGSGPLQTYSRTTTDPAAPPFVDDKVYLYHTRLFRVGNAGDGGSMPARVRVASSDGGVDTLAVKQWVGKDGSGAYPATFQKDFTTKYLDPVESSTRVRSLASEFSNIAQVVDLPNKTAGYQRKAQAIVGTTTPYTGSVMTDSRNNVIGGLDAANQTQAVVLTSKAWGQDGGNGITVALVKPSGNDQPPGVTVAGSAITVSLATDATGAVTSTAAQVVAAVNASAGASALVSATKLRTNAGAGVVAPTATTQLTDYLKAPAAYPRGPQTVPMLRIGSHRDGSKVGVFIYCQEHAREWATSLVCLETAERLLRNYGTDPETTKLVDNLDIFIVPMVNPDGIMYSRYDFNFQRRNMVNYCASNPTGNNDPVARNSWGVDLNRNFSAGSYFDGYDGGGANCNGDTFSGPFEFSEPEARNEQWIQDTFANIKFAMNVHSYGGYFMWPPGAYKLANRETLPYPSYGTLQYFDQSAAGVLDRVKSYRGTAVLPSRTGPVADVLYSAAGNSADEAYYNHGIIGYDFEVGVDRFQSTSTGTLQSIVSFQPDYATEGHEEGMEFANGNYALLASAVDYANDTTPPVVSPTGPDISPTPFDVRFDQSEAAEIHYTTDGSTPTASSATYQPPRARALPAPIHIGATTTLRWIAKDFKGNTSTGSKTLYIGTRADGGVSATVPATLSLALAGPASFGAFTPGFDKTYTTKTTATVVSTAGNATLTLSDPGRLANGAFSLAEPPAVTTDTSSWNGPVSNATATIGFSQHIGANEPLRTGSYSQTLTFTLSTTSP